MLVIDCSQGGFNNNPNIDMIEPFQMASNSRNINIHNNYKQPRGGTSKVNGTAVSGAPDITAIIDYYVSGQTQYIVFATSDGKIYKNSVDTIKTGLSTAANTFPCFTVYRNILYFNNGVDITQIWDGTTQSELAAGSRPSAWTTNPPIQMAVHGKGLAERMWAVNKTNYLYASTLGGTDFDDAAAPILYIDSSVSQGGLVGCIEWRDSLWAFSKDRFVVIDDSDASIANWGYEPAPWNIGAASWRLVAKTDNDLLAMTDYGDIYSVGAAIQTGDFEAASIVRPFYIDRWIRDNIDLSKIEQFHCVQDKTLRSVNFFMVGNGSASSQCNICLPWFYDKKAWGAPRVNASYNSGYSAVCSASVQKSVGVKKIYTGDYSGFVWELETSNINDDSNAYPKIYEFPYSAQGNPVMTKMYDQLRAVTEPEGNFDLDIQITVDTMPLASQELSLAGTGAVLGDFTLDTDVLGGDSLIDGTIPIGVTGKRIKGSISNTAVNEDFRISALLILYQELGVQP